MTSRDFCYWLQGYFELTKVGSGPTPQTDPMWLTQDQTSCIQKHLNMVFYHEIDPSYGPSNPGLKQIHHGKQQSDIAGTASSIDIKDFQHTMINC